MTIPSLRRTSACVVLLSLTSLLAGCGRSSRSTDNPLADGVRQLEGGDPTSAITTFDALIAAQPKYAAAYYYRGRAHNLAKQPTKAIGDYTQAIDLDLAFRNDPSTLKSVEFPLGRLRTDAYVRRAQLLDDAGKRDAAIENFTAAIEFDHDAVDAFNGRGMLFLAKGLPDVAADDFTDAIRVDPLNHLAFAKRGEARMKFGDYVDAIADCRAAVRLNPNCAECFANLGTSYAALSMPEKNLATHAFNEAARLQPSLRDEMNQKIAAVMQPSPEDEPSEGRVGRPEYVPNLPKPELNPSPLAPAEVNIAITSQLHEADKARENRKFDDAIALYSAVLQQDNRVSEAWYGRGLTFLEKGFPDTAVQDFDETIRLSRKAPELLAPYGPYPDLSQVYFERARAFEQQGSSILASSDATQAIRLQPKFADAYLLRANAYLDHENFDRVFPDLDEAIRLNRDLGKQVKTLGMQACVGRGAVRVEQRELSAAFDDLNKAIAMDSQYARAYRVRGFAYAADSNWNEAIQDFETAMRLNPKVETPIVRKALAAAKRQSQVVIR